MESDIFAISLYVRKRLAFRGRESVLAWILKFSPGQKVLIEFSSNLHCTISQ